MTLDELLNNLHQAVVSESNTGDSEISNQRERNYRAYYMEPLESDVSDDDEDTGGRADFVTSDVFDTVEDTKACLSETFAAHRNTIRFKQSASDDRTTVELANEYVKEVFWDQNHGEEFIRDSAHDGCLAKNAVAKVYWKTAEEGEELPVANMHPEMVLMMLAEDGIEPAEDFDEHEMGFSGHVTVARDTSYPCVELLPPENFFADHNQSSHREFLVAQDRTPFTRDELKELGLTEDQLDNLNPNSMTDLRDTEDVSRHVNDATYEFYETELATDGQEELWVYNAHFIADLDDNGPRPWYIQYVGTLALSEEHGATDLTEGFDIQEAIKKGFVTALKRMPYHVWSPYPLSHRWSGMGVADPVYVIQELRSKMQRSIIDYMSRTNNPRTQGDAENVRNFNEFIENPIGGFADLEDPSKPISSIDQPQMTPLVFQTLEMVTQERDERVPVTRLSSGRNQDVITNQNAESMVDKLTSRGDRRMAMVARSYATFLKGILIDLFLTGIENDDRPMQLEVDGEPVQVVPSQLPRRREMSVSVALTPQESIQEANRLMGMHNSFLADPVLSDMYLPENRYQMMSEVAELMDRKDFSRFLSAPDSEEYQAAQQQKAQAAQAQQQQMVQMQGMMIQMQQQFAAQMEQFKAQQRQWEKQLEATLKREQMELDAVSDADQNELGERAQFLDEAEFSHQQQVDAAELALEAAQARPVSVGQ